MLDLFQLLMNRGVDSVVTVSKEDSPTGGNSIEIRLSVCVVQVSTLAALDNYG